jgi:hypothetical protein
MEMSLNAMVPLPRSLHEYGRDEESGKRQTLRVLALRLRPYAIWGGTGATSENPYSLSAEVVMRKVILVPAMLCGITVIASAQGRITGKLTCPKPGVSEAAGSGAQMIMFQRANCTWSTPITIDGSKAGRTVNASISDVTGSTAKAHGYSTSVMDNGDSTIVRYEGTSQMKKDGSGSLKGTWRYVRGTGKFSGISGSGTFKGEAAADGTSWADINGHYSLGKRTGK